MIEPTPSIVDVKNPKTFKSIYLIPLVVVVLLLGVGYMYIHNGSPLNTSAPTLTTDVIPKLSSGKLLILIEDNLAEGLESETTTYASDVKRELGWETEVKRVDMEDDIFTLKSFVKNYYQTQGLDGLLLIGSIPTGNMYHSDVDKDSVFNSEGYALQDSIYQDLYDDCEYSTQKQAFNYKKIECQTGITIQPYWVARLTPNSTTESALSNLKNYFAQNHAFRTGAFSFRNNQLAYTPIISTDADVKKEIMNFKDEFVAYDNYIITDLTFIDPFSANSDEQYISAISEPYRYEAVTFNGHGSPDFHQKNIHAANIDAASFVFLNLLSCSVGRFTTPGYLAGKYLFEGGLIELAASTPIFVTGNFDKDLYAMLSQGVPFYKAFNFGGHGGNILGDPTLKMRYANTSKSGARMALSSKEFSFTASSPEQKLEITNSGTEPLYFNARLKLLKQKNSSHFNGTSYGLNSDILTAEGKPNTIMPGKTGILSFQPEYLFVNKNLPPGTYEAKFLIVSNDSKQPLVEIPMHFKKD